jgi:hypothetical protein
MLAVGMCRRPTWRLHHSEQIRGCQSFRICPLSHAAEACFGTPERPPDQPAPQLSIEFDVGDAKAAGMATRELEQTGDELLHSAREEPHGARRLPGCKRQRERSSASPTSHVPQQLTGSSVFSIERRDKAPWMV